jgi:hypothetical protein
VRAGTLAGQLSKDGTRLTFSGAPNNSTAKPQARDSYSHTRFEVMKISDDNSKLCKRLLEISTASGAAFGPPPVHLEESAAAVNRRRREDRIALENLAIYKRLQSVKPSPDISRDTLSKHFAAQKAYGANARKVRPAARAGQLSPSRATRAEHEDDVHTEQQPLEVHNVAPELEPELAESQGADTVPDAQVVEAA